MQIFFFNKGDAQMESGRCQLPQKQHVGIENAFGKVVIDISVVGLRIKLSTMRWASVEDSYPNLQ